ncbi:hypothetical protein DFH29DRAFT_1002812 [Suillus ampliporus]|nr:hypothetical protein DFH29DRAFT_1002812 [Suillus ampliporus]
MKAIIIHRLSTFIQQLVSTSHKVLTYNAWKYLEDYFGHTDVSSQHVIRQGLYALHMRDAANALNYIGCHVVLHEHFGLPQSATWSSFKSISLATSLSLPLTFDTCIAWISAEAACLTDEHALESKLGSEYMNTITAVPTTNNVNPITGLHKHCHNPEGMFCTTGGGMEGQAPWLKNKKKEAVMAAVAAKLFLANLSCTSIIEIPDANTIPLSPVNAEVLSCLVAAGFNIILDSVMTTILIQDCSYFWTYSTTDIVIV